MEMIDEDLIFENDALYRYTLMPQRFGTSIYKKELVITKKAFIECYKKWIKEIKNGNDD